MWRRLFSELCPCCAGPTSGGYCRDCIGDCRTVADPCAGCGLPQPVGRCPRRIAGWAVDIVVAPYVYGSPLKERIHAFKFGGQRRLGRAMGLLAAQALAPRLAEVDALVAVPLHPSRLRERGYNQALEVARSVARELDLRLLVRGISRPRRTPAQTALKAADRERNLAHAFRVARRMAGRRVWIVDDVITTGATINSLARALKTAGAASVGALAVARTLD
jgi:ComF family protein